MSWVEQIAWIVRRRDRGWTSWGLAAAFFAAALAFRLTLPPEAGRLPFLIFFPAILAAELACGLAPGLVVLAAAALSGWYLFLPPIHTFSHTADALVSLAAFVMAGAILVAVVEGLAQAVAKAETLALANADLFRELQHRVANNFQIVAATLQKARRGVSDPEARSAIDGAVSRIQAMAAMHRRLYDAKSYSQGLEPVLTAVVADVFADIAVKTRIAVAPQDLTIGEMTAITLLVNEAALNAAKHVFRPARGEESFEVTLAPSAPGRLELAIRDDGPGIPRETREADGRPRFGMAVMRSLAEQLGGVLELPGGGRLRVEFPSGARV